MSEKAQSISTAKKSWILPCETKMSKNCALFQWLWKGWEDSNAIILSNLMISSNFAAFNDSEKDEKTATSQPHLWTIVEYFPFQWLWKGWEDSNSTNQHIIRGLRPNSFNDSEKDEKTATDASRNYDICLLWNFQWLWNIFWHIHKRNKKIKKIESLRKFMLLYSYTQ